MHHNHHHHDQMPKGSRVLVMIMICFFGLADSESPWPPACSSSEGGHPIPTGNKNYPRTSMPLRLHHRLRDGDTPRRNHVRGPSIDWLGASCCPLLLIVSFFLPMNIYDLRGPRLRGRYSSPSTATHESTRASMIR